MAKRNFVVKDRNLYSMARLVDENKSATIAQFIQAQTFCYYFDITIKCSFSCRDMCDILTEVNNRAYRNELPGRDNSQKGRAYLNKRGEMVFSDKNKKPYPAGQLIDIGLGGNLALGNLKYINNALQKNVTEPLSQQERASMLIPESVDVESIKAHMMELVKKYRFTFDMKRSEIELFKAQQKTIVTIEQNSERLIRKEQGESYLDIDNVIKFRPFMPEEASTVVAPVAKVPVQSSLDDMDEKLLKELLESCLVSSNSPKLKTRTIYITSCATEGNTSRLVYFGTKDEIHVLECPFRTTAKAYTIEAIKKATELYSKFTINVEPRAKTLVDYYNLAPDANKDAFTSKFDLEINTIYNNCPTFEIVPVNTKDTEYICFVESVKTKLA